MTMAQSAIKILRRFYIFMRRTIISNFSFKRCLQTESKGESSHGLTLFPLTLSQ